MNPPFLLKEIIEINDFEISLIDIGAMLEGEPRYKQLRDNYRTILTAFEPDETQYKRLLEQKEESTNYLNCFIGSGNEAIFNIARYPGCSSLYEPNSEVIDLFTGIDSTSDGGNFTVKDKQSVTTARLDDVYNLSDAHWIKLDIQGSELDALKGAVKTLASTLVVEVEVEFLPLYKNQPLFGEVHSFFLEQGFQLHKLIDVGGRCYRPFLFNNNPRQATSQILWADAILVRDFLSVDENYSDQDLIITAILLHDIYLSYDMVHFFLSIYDKRRNTKYGQQYLNRLSQSGELKTMYLNQRLDS